MKYFYVVMGYAKVEKKFGGEEFFDAAKAHVEAETEEQAIEEAKKMIKKPLYKVVEGSYTSSLGEKQFELNKQIAENNAKITEINAKMTENVEALGKAIDKLAAKA